MVLHRRITKSRMNTRSFERPPVILEWGSWMIRIGCTEDCLPKHFVLLPSETTTTTTTSTAAGTAAAATTIAATTTNTTTETNASVEEWYVMVIRLLHQCWDRLMTSPASRRVVIVHPPLMPRAWEAAMTQALWNLGVPALVFVSMLETPPLALQWKRGMVVHVGRKEAYCLAHADGHAIHNTLQIAPCGYDVAVPDSIICSNDQESWTTQMDQTWLNESNPNSLLLAVATCLEKCPQDVRKDVAGNIVFCGETSMLIPQLPFKLLKRLTLVCSGDAPEPEDDIMILEESTSDLIHRPISYKRLKRLTLTACTTGPYRPDFVSWIGASLYAAVHHRHDEDQEQMNWIPNLSRTL